MGSVEGCGQVDASARHSRLGEVELMGATDVTSPLLETDGAARLFGSQKGADAAAVEEPEAALAHAATVMGAQSAGWPCTGAVGGFGFSLVSQAGARRVPGDEQVSRALGLERRVLMADGVLTDEGGLRPADIHGQGPRRAGAAGPRAQHAGGALRRQRGPAGRAGTGPLPRGGGAGHPAGPAGGPALEGALRGHRELGRDGHHPASSSALRCVPEGDWGSNSGLHRREPSPNAPWLSRECRHGWQSSSSCTRSSVQGCRFSMALHPAQTLQPTGDRRHQQPQQPRVPMPSPTRLSRVHPLTAPLQLGVAQSATSSS